MEKEKTPEEQILYTAKNVAAALILENENKAASLVNYAQASALELKKLLDAHKEDAQNMLVQALKKVVEGGHEGDKMILIQRIPFICNDIKMIKTFGMYILLGIGSLFILLLGNLLLNHIGIAVK